MERYAYGVRSMDFDSSLAPYDLPHHATWWHLSNFINQAVINRLRKGHSAFLILQVLHRFWGIFIGLGQECRC